MSGVTVTTEALEQAAAALGTYIEEVSSNIQKMKSAAQDCSDNMASDVYSRSAIEKLEACIAGLSKTVMEAGSIRQKILKKKSEIEFSMNGF